MGFLNPPKPPSASSLIAAGTKANKTAIEQSQAAQGQAFGPFQNVTQAFGPIDPVTGIRRLNTTTTLSPENQAAFSQLMGNKAGVGAGLGGLIGNVDLTQAFDPNTANALTDQMMGNFNSFMEPYYQRQDNSLQTRLSNQGATDNARQFAEMRQNDERARQQGMFFNQARGQAFGEAREQYDNPRRTIQQLMSMIGPYFGQQQGPTGFNAQTVDAPGLMNTAYNNKLQSHQNMWSGIGALGSAIAGFPLGTAAGAVPTIGSTIGGGIGSLFS